VQTDQVHLNVTWSPTFKAVESFTHNTMAETNFSNLPPIRRLITTHDSSGKATFSNAVSDDLEFRDLPNGAKFWLAYTTKEFPVNLNQERDIEDYKLFLESPPGLVASNGTVLRFVDAPPDSLSPMHRTVSLDYGVVIEGEMELVLDSGEVKQMKRGDVAIQRATMHAWRNPSKTEWARMMYVLQGSKAVSVDGKELGEEYGDMQGVPKST
jgi:quercetin dioxygenase-like cupin family protein